MSLRDVIDDVEGREKRLTPYDPPTESLRIELEEYFASQQVRIEVATTDSNRSGTPFSRPGTTTGCSPLSTSGAFGG